MKNLLLVAFGLCFASGVHAAGNAISYVVTLSPDGSRVAVGKTQKRPQWEMFEGVIQQPLRPVNLPAGAYFTGAFVYAPDGKDLLFASAPIQSLAATDGKQKLKPSSLEAIEGAETLWKASVGQSPVSVTKLFDHWRISNVMPLQDGSIAFMGATKRSKNPVPSLFGGGRRVWTSYQWMLRKPDGTVVVLNPKEYIVYSNASLIRDEAIVLVQQRLDQHGSGTNEYGLDVTMLKPGADLSPLARLSAMHDRADGPRLECDWGGKTCLRIIAYVKNQYFAHQLEVIREGKVCKVLGLPDRLEKSAISRDGSTIALVTRGNPDRDTDYQLVHFKIEMDGCAGDKKFTALP